MANISDPVPLEEVEALAENLKTGKLLDESMVRDLETLTEERIEAAQQSFKPMDDLNGLAEAAVSSEMSWDDPRWDRIDELFERARRDIKSGYEEFSRVVGSLSFAFKDRDQKELSERIEDVRDKWIDFVNRILAELSDLEVGVKLVHSERTPRERGMGLGEFNRHMEAQDNEAAELAREITAA